MTKTKIIPRDKGFKQKPFKMPKVKPPCLIKQDQSPAALQKPNAKINRL
jgi:hypothetical protein